MLQNQKGVCALLLQKRLTISVSFLCSVRVDWSIYISPLCYMFQAIQAPSQEAMGGIVLLEKTIYKSRLISASFYSSFSLVFSIIYFLSFLCIP
jgi:hypothetical protein